MQSKPAEIHEQQPETSERRVLQLELEVLEERIAPSLFAYSGAGTATSTIDWSRYINWGEPFHP
jgi:hypothetical protein